MGVETTTNGVDVAEKVEDLMSQVPVGVEVAEDGWQPMEHLISESSRCFE